MFVYFFTTRKIKVWDLVAALDPRAPAGTLCLRTLVVRAFGRGVGGGRKVCLIRAVLSHENSSQLSRSLQDLEIISRGLAFLGVQLFFNVASYKALKVRTCGVFAHFLTVLFCDFKLITKSIFETCPSWNPCASGFTLTCVYLTM